MDQDLARLLSLISHEVRAPVGVMRGYLRLLEQQGDELSEPHRNAVVAALRAADRATEILGQVSALARLHRGEVSASMKTLALEPLLQSAIQTIVMPSEPRVTLQIRMAGSVTLRADEELLRAALAGLTSAVVRAQALDIRVFLHAREEQRDGQHGVSVTVAAAESPNASHVDVPLDLSRGGIALELPIAEFVIAAHNGRVLERRENDRFAGVVVWLPVQ
jgi:signal transduction histidine kinase